MSVILLSSFFPSISIWEYNLLFESFPVLRVTFAPAPFTEIPVFSPVLPAFNLISVVPSNFTIPCAYTPVPSLVIPLLGSVTASIFPGLVVLFLTP